MLVWTYCRGQTHKRDVLDYCQKMSQAAREDSRLLDRDSTELLWKFLHLLVKQNGVSVYKRLLSVLVMWSLIGQHFWWFYWSRDHCWKFHWLCEHYWWSYWSKDHCCLFHWLCEHYWWSYWLKDHCCLFHWLCKHYWWSYWLKDHCCLLHRLCEHYWWSYWSYRHYCWGYWSYDCCWRSYWLSKLCCLFLDICWLWYSGAVARRVRVRQHPLCRTVST